MYERTNGLRFLVDTYVDISVPLWDFVQEKKVNETPIKIFPKKGTMMNT